jgi:phosphoglycolate phosphatase-like HAD superfamily hydrolase
MEIKHKECFAPNTIKYWELQAVSKYAREAAEFVNLYSKWRGINRWPALVMVLDLLRDRPEVRARHVVPPAALRIREFMASGLPLSNDGLEQYLAEPANTDDQELATALAWSKAVNAAIADMVHGVPPFPYLRESLAFLVEKADMMVVSATPQEALAREWEEHDIAKFVRIIAGQEMGSKSEHLSFAAKGKFSSDHILMIGDAPGDMKAARANHALFFPVNPGHEDESWERFYKEAVHRFLSGEYAGEYEDKLIAEFDKLLPEVPPWQQ